MDSEAKKLLKENDFLKLSDNGRIKCDLTGHEMPAKSAAILNHIRGKKVIKLIQQRADKSDLIEQYKPFIVPSKYQSGKVFCRITGKYFDYDEKALIRHSEGKKFEKGVEFVEAGAKLKTEPSPEEVAEEHERRQKKALMEARAREQIKQQILREERGELLPADEELMVDSDGEIIENNAQKGKQQKKAEDKATEEDEDEDEGEEGIGFWVPPWAEEARSKRKPAEEASDGGERADSGSGGSDQSSDAPSDVDYDSDGIEIPVFYPPAIARAKQQKKRQKLRNVGSGTDNPKTQITAGMQSTQISGQASKSATTSRGKAKGQGSKATSSSMAGGTADSATRNVANGADVTKQVNGTAGAQARKKYNKGGTMYKMMKKNVRTSGGKKSG